MLAATKKGRNQKHSQKWLETNVNECSHSEWLQKATERAGTLGSF